MIMKFNFVIDTMDKPVQQMQDIVKERITYLITSYTHSPRPSPLGGTLPRYQLKKEEMRGRSTSPGMAATCTDLKKLLEGGVTPLFTPRFAYRNVLALLDMASKERYNSDRACAELRLRKTTMPRNIDLKEIVRQF